MEFDNLQILRIQTCLDMRITKHNQFSWFSYYLTPSHKDKKIGYSSSWSFLHCQPALRENGQLITEEAHKFEFSQDFWRDAKASSLEWNRWLMSFPSSSWNTQAYWSQIDWYRQKVSLFYHWSRSRWRSSLRKVWDCQTECLNRDAFKDLTEEEEICWLTEIAHLIGRHSSRNLTHLKSQRICAQYE